MDRNGLSVVLEEANESQSNLRVTQNYDEKEKLLNGTVEPPGF